VAELEIKDLLEAGVHFGHQTRRWNPKMKKFIFTERNGIYIIDLKKSLELINKACDVIREITAKGGLVLYVGTKAQAATTVKEEAERSGQFYVSNRWLGGMLTNYRTIRQSVKRLEHIEKMSSDGTYEHLTKKEILTTEKHKQKLLHVLGGIREMNRIPGLVIVVDTRRENIAVREANRLGIPVCAIIDTNCDPDPIDYPVPGNDDAIRSIKIIISKITDAVIEGIQMRDEEEAVSVKEAQEEIPEAAQETIEVSEAVSGKDEEKKKDEKDAGKLSPREKSVKHPGKKADDAGAKGKDAGKTAKKDSDSGTKKKAVESSAEEKRADEKSKKDKAAKEKKAEKTSAKEKEDVNKGKEDKASKKKDDLKETVEESESA